MGVVAVEPKSGSYVTEWVASQYVEIESFSVIKRLLKNSPWEVRLFIDDPLGPSIVATTMHHGSMETWTIRNGDWVIKSPYGKVWFMGHFEFTNEFEVVP